MDPHGADRRGNPLGGLLFSNAFPANAGNANNFQQVIEWHNFMGGGVFCLKACDPAGPDAADFCEHIFDRIGCQYNAPAAYVDGVFESCLGDNQDFPGIYTGSDGVVTTYKQPAESLGEIKTMPYDARIPASSSCTPYQSSQIYGSGASIPAATATATGANASSKPSSTVRAAAAASSTAATNGAIVNSGSLASVILSGLLGLVALM